MELAREQMVAEQIEARGVNDARVLEALRQVPRHEFVPAHYQRQAYHDHPVPIGESQTISQPYIVALMAAALRLQPGEKVLEIGTGSGYAAAVLAAMGMRVYSVEHHRSLFESASQRLKQLGYPVHTLLADGTLGWPAEAPFDAIVVAAAGPRVPEALKRQLREGGRLLMPVGSEESQELVLVQRQGRNSFTTEKLGHVRFVPLIGDQGWPE